MFDMCAWMMCSLPQSCRYPNLSESADRVGRQLCGDEECPFSNLTSSGRVWKKVADGDAGSGSVSYMQCGPGSDVQCGSGSNMQSGSDMQCGSGSDMQCGSGFDVQCGPVSNMQCGSVSNM